MKTSKASDLNLIAPEFAKLTSDFLFGDIWKRPGLSDRDKSLVTITTLVALNRIEQVEYHFKLGLQNGLTKEEIVAAISHKDLHIVDGATSGGI